MKKNILLFLIMLLCTMQLSAVVVIVDQYGRLQVHGSYVCSVNGEQISLSDMSMLWSNWASEYYNASTVGYLVDDFNIAVIRAAYGVSESEGPNGDYSAIERVVDAANNRGIYVLIDWHIEGDAWPYEQQAKDFFKYMTQKYGTYPNVINELYNEPTFQADQSIKDWCQTMINVIRQYDSDNLIICGSKTWSQYPNSFKINDRNVAYSFHGYFDDPQNGHNHVSQFYNSVQTAMDMGNAVFVTELGANNTCRASKISHSLDKGGWEFDPFAGFGFELNSDKTPYDLTGSSGISFWHKGDGCQVRVSSSSVNQLGAEHYIDIGNSRTWRKIDVNWSDFSQPEWANKIPFDNSTIVVFLWHKEGVTGETGEIYIDEVKIEGHILFKQNNIKENFSIDTSNLEEGIYTLNLIENTNIETNKIIAVIDLI